MADLSHPIYPIERLIVAAEFSAQPFAAAALDRTFVQNNEQFAGFGALSGTLATGPLETPSARTVRLYDRITGQLVAETRSAANGAYTFANVDPSRQYTALGLDDLPIVYEADAADGLSATPIRPAT